MSLIKKSFFILLFITIILGLFWGVYKLSFQEKNISKTEDKTNSQLGTSPVEKEEPGEINLVVDEKILSPTLSEEGNKILYFSQEDQQGYEVDFYGAGKKNIFPSRKENLKSLAWSIDRSGIILETKSGTDEDSTFSYYNLKKKTETPIKKGVDEIVWQNNANRIFYKYYDSQTGQRTLNVSDPDGSNWKKLADISYRNISIVQIPKTGEVSFWNSPDAFSVTNLKIVSLLGGEVKEISKEFYGADYLWNNSGKQILTSQSYKKGGKKMQLGIMDKDGGGYKNLGIPTFVSKCVWSKDDQYIFCALPGNIPDEAILPNDYQTKKFNTADTFWKINVKNGEKTRLVEVDKIKKGYDAENLFLDKSESVLFFVNRSDGKLYKIIL